MPVSPESQGALLSLTLSLRYSHAFGELAPYFHGLERGIAMATRCRSCKRAWFPPRLVCRCKAHETPEWIELAGTGSVVAVTSGPLILPMGSSAEEVAFGLVSLDGASNRAFSRLAAGLGAGARIRLTRAEGSFPHPAQHSFFVAL
jgi:uncharacterized OB-fold protein